MNEILIFLAGFFSALTLVAATVTVVGIYWFFSYGRRLKARQLAEQIPQTQAEQARAARKLPWGMDGDDL